MKKIVIFLIGCILLLPLTSWADVFEPYALKKIPGAFYLTPAASSKDFALFGYMRKITPTPEEIEAEKKRTVPLLMKGALLYAKAHPEATREPVGNVGETGIIVASGQPGATESRGSLLEKIEKNPERFANKIVELDGWAWGWMARPPKGVRLSSLHFAKHNYGSRMDGTFTDGVVQILYPVPVKFSGPFHLKARVTITPWGWQLVPVD